MSRAFVRESDQDSDPLPERRISEHPNLVTPRGLALLDQRVRELERGRAAARSSDNPAALAALTRDLRYFLARRDSAKLIEAPADPQVVRFGVAVVLRDAQGREQRFRLVGEDEADPAQGLISYVSPLARNLIGQRAGATVRVAEQSFMIGQLER